MENEQIDITKFRFWSFLDFRENNGRITPIWRAEPKLQRNIQCLVELNRDITEESWARIFLIVVRAILWVGVDGGQNFAKQYLSAYLQITCHFVAIKLSCRHSSVELLRRQYTYQDYCQIGNSFAVEPGKFLQNFLLDSPFAIQAYAKKRLEGLVIGEIRKQNKHVDWDKYKGWGLLRNAGVTELRASLKGRMNLNKVEQHVLAWQCFKEIYAPKTSTGSRHLAPPNNEEFQQIAQRYNQRRLELSEPGEAVDEGRVRQMLEDCISGVRDWRTVSFSYPDANKDVFDPSSGDRWETITQDVLGYTSNASLARLEQEEEWNQINAVLSQAFSQLPTYDQNLLRLWETGLGANQTEMAMVLNLKPYQISRQLKRCKRPLLRTFAEWCKENLNLHLNNEIIAQLDAPIKEWLEKHCQRVLYSLLESILLSLDSEERRLLQLYYCQNLIQEQIARELGIPVLQVCHKLANVKQIILTNFTLHLAVNLEIHSNSLKPVAHRSEAFLESGLKTIVCFIH